MIDMNENSYHNSYNHDLYLAKQLDEYDRQRASEIPEEWILKQAELQSERATYVEESLIAVEEMACTLAMATIANISGKILLKYPEVVTIMYNVHLSEWRKGSVGILGFQYGSSHEPYDGEKEGEFIEFAKSLLEESPAFLTEIGSRYVSLFQGKWLELHKTSVWTISDGSKLFHDITQY